MDANYFSPVTRGVRQTGWHLLAILSITGGLGFAQAPTVDGPTGAIQESLRRQQYYSGEITGKYDQSTRDAVRRFQIRNALKVTGELDAPTLEAIAAAERQSADGPARVASTESEEVPARERTRELVQDDREFLENLEDEPAGGPPRDAASTPPPPAPIAEAPRREQVEIVEERPPSPRPAAPEPRREVTQAVEERPPTQEPPRTEPRGTAISEAEARKFVERYLDAAEGETPEREIAFYGDRVNYFGKPRFTKEAIAKDQRAYYKRWPDRQFELTDEPQVVKMTEGEATVRFRIRYHVQRGKEDAKGRTENIMRIQKDRDGLKIVGIRERKL
jgi:hypothetical protein